MEQYLHMVKQEVVKHLQLVEVHLIIIIEE